jgi:C-3',4' desaturase CrtD
MQVLSDAIVGALEKYGGKLIMRHRVEKIHADTEGVVGVTVRNEQTGKIWLEKAEQVVANVTGSNLVKMVEDKAIPFSYKRRIDKLPDASGAFVVYLGVARSAIPDGCPPHLQFLYDYEKPIGENNSLFVSVSKAGDGRAPAGKATVIASSFTDIRQWWRGSKQDYEQLKAAYSQEAIARLGEYFHLTPETIIHQEAATPRTFAKFTARDRGMVGGVGQRISTFGPFGLATRTPIKNLWLVGDSTHPGEGTAGVSYSALMAVRQIMNG